MCWSSLVTQRVKHLPVMLETQVQSLEKEMATHCRTLAWKIPWTEKPSRLYSMGSQRVGHDWVTTLTVHFNFFMCWFFPLFIFFSCRWFQSLRIIITKDAWYDFSFSKIYWNFFHGLVYDLSWKIFHVHLKWMCILLLLDGILYTHVYIYTHTHIYMYTCI